MGWWFSLAPATLEFWDSFHGNQGQQAHPALKYRVLYGCQGQKSMAHQSSFDHGTPRLSGTNVKTEAT
jgi:hypothetical protein